MKKHDLPAMPFYWGDWFKCPEVRALTPAARCLWFEMLGLMWESTPRGYLVLNHKPYPKEALSRCLGFACDLLDVLLSELEQYAVYSKTDNGIIYSRKMVRDCEISKIRAEAGKKGGICSSKNQANIQANTEDENEDENENTNVIKDEIKKGINKGGFSHPSIEDVKAYCLERSNTVDPEAWYAFYESNGWKVGRNAMKNWKAAIITWEKKEYSKPASRTVSRFGPQPFTAADAKEQMETLLKLKDGPNG